ncbi:MAG: hypothetical protein WAT21_12870 [Saprospiraceae bacterium]
MKKLILLCLTWCAILNLQAQNFLPAFDLFSKNKPCYITLKDGTKIEGEIDKIDRRKGLIEEITIETADKKEHELEAKDIKEMYLPASGFQKLMDMDNAMMNVKTYSGEIDMEHIKKGYAYFVSTKVILKKEPEDLLMQVVNPGFSEKILVFHDPQAAETASVGIGGFTVAGGDDKSYFIKVGEDAAYKLKKKDYSDAFPALFNDCPEIIKQYGKKPVWTDFDTHVYECTTGLSAKAPKN